MKHDDATLQAAIDAALIATEASSQTFTTCPETYPKSWAKESPVRLALAKAFLAKLPAELQASEADSTDWKARAAKAEAELTALKYSTVGILRPLPEDGPVPDGCVRINGHFYADRWYLGWQKDDKDTHFADIRIPSTDTPAPVNEQPKQQVPLGPEEKLQAIKDILEIK